MALIACKECGTEISSKAKACPKCGVKMSRTKLWLWIPLGLVAAFFLLGFILSNTPQGQAKARDRAAIELCWKEQQRKSLDPSTQRFAASACEMMERNFVQKYGVSP